MRAKLFLAISGSALAFGAQAAAAQEAPPQQADDSQAFGEIIVTAQKRAENIQKVPISISAVQAETLANANVESAVDLPKLVGGLGFNNFAGVVNPFIRGVGNPASAVGNESSTAVYIDGVYYARLAPQLLELNNVERIEVLKGPQGTLFGRNADAGLIHIITREPGTETSLRAEAGYANYETYTGSLYAATPISDKISADIAVRGMKQADGWGVNIANGEEVGKAESFAARSKWVFSPSEATTIALAGEYFWGKTDQFLPTNHFTAHGNFFPPFDTVYPPLDYHNTNVDGTDISRNEGYGGSLKVSHDMGDLTVNSITAYHRQTGAFEVDVDRTPQDVWQFTGAYLVKQFSQELQLSSPTGQDLEWTIGAFYMSLRAGYNPATFSGPMWQQNFSLPNGQFEIFSTQRMKSYAGYAQATYRITDDTRFTGGIRYTSDHVSATGHNDIVDPVLGVRVNTGDLSDERTFNKVTFRLSLDHDFARNILGYASFNRGFKAGTFNLLPLAVPPVKPEVLDAYEIGLKAQMFDNRVRLNIAAFLWDMKNLQVQRFDGPGISLLNAATARSKGMDIDLDVMPVDDLVLRASATVLEAKYRSFEGAPFANINPLPPFGLDTAMPFTPGNAAGNHLPNAPTLRLSVGANYILTSSIGKWSFSGNYAYESGHYFDADNIVKSPKTGLLDGRISFSPGSSETFTISVWGRNLTNEKYYTGTSEQPTPAGIEVVEGAPRTYGVTLGFDL